MSGLFVCWNKQMAGFIAVKGLTWTVTMTRKRSQQKYERHEIFIPRAASFTSDPPTDLYAPNTVMSAWIDTCIIDISDILWQRDWNTNLSPRENSAPPRFYDPLYRPSSQSASKQRWMTVTCLQNSLLWEWIAGYMLLMYCDPAGLRLHASTLGVEMIAAFFRSSLAIFRHTQARSGIFKSRQGCSTRHRMYRRFKCCLHLEYIMVGWFGLFLLLPLGA
jgi:hypothetical protein